jgi:hypothetical protein
MHNPEERPTGALDIILPAIALSILGLFAFGLALLFPLVGYLLLGVVLFFGLLLALRGIPNAATRYSACAGITIGLLILLALVTIISRL